MTDLAWLDTPWVIIAGMALMTAATRYSGYLLLGRMNLSERSLDALNAVPASILTAIIAPTILTTGVAESAAALVTILVAWRFPALAAIIAGVLVVFLLRQEGF